MPEHLLPDAIRALNIGAWALLVGQAIGIIASYMKAHRLMRQRHKSVPGLLPMHVWLVAGTLIVMSTEVMVFTVRFVGTPLTIWGPLNLLLFGAGNYALWLVFRFERRRVVEYQPVTVVHLPGETLVMGERRAEHVDPPPDHPNRRRKDPVVQKPTRRYWRHR